MFVVPPSIEKYREPVEVVFLAPAADQLKRSCGLRSGTEPMKEPRPRTSSISCSVDLCASKLLPGGRTNWKDFEEFRVTIPSNVPVNPPIGSKWPGVFKPRTRPFAAETVTFVDKALPGKLALAVVSFAVFASAFSALM